MKGNKFLAAVLAASMAFSTVPVTALNVFASATVEAPASVAAGFPSNVQVKTALAGLTTTDSSNISAITTTQVDSALNTAISGDWSALGLTLSVNASKGSGTKAASDASGRAYQDFDFTLALSSDSTKTQAYTVRLAADKLTDAEAQSIISDYMTDYITANGPIVRGTTAVSDLKAKAQAAATAFTTKYGVMVTVDTSTTTMDASGNYSIAFSAPNGTDAVTGKAALFYKDSQVSVENKTNGTSAGRKALKAAVLSMNVNIASHKSGKTYDTDAIATDVTNALSGYTAQNVSVTDDDNWSFEAYDSTGTYTVKIGTGADLETANADLKTALDNYFASNEVTTTKDKTLRNTDIATIVSNDDDVNAASTGYTITGDGNALGSDGSGKLTVKNTSSNATYTYTFKADIKISDKSEAEANKEALATVNANTYPDYNLDGTLKFTETTKSVAHDKALLEEKLKADLKDAGYNTNSIDSFGAASKEDADKTTNGEYKNSLLDANSKVLDFVDVALTYSSDQKLVDTEKALEKFLAKGSASATNSYTYTTHKKTSSAVKLDDADVAAPTEEYKYSETSALSQKVQAKTAIKATSAADAADIVKAAIDEQLTSAGIADNGVSVSVKAVNKATADDGKYNVTEDYTAATPNDKGTDLTLLVTASIKNDFYGWKNTAGKEDKAKTISYSYLMDITTNKLKENKAKSISLADKTVLLTGGYYSKDKAGTKSTEDVTYVEITPVVDPADTNSEIKYTVFDSDKSDISDEVKVGTDAVSKIYKNDSTTAIKVGTNALGLAITKEGTYTIKAKVDDSDAEATMTLTVKKNFDDVPATAYYAKAVKWAYANGMTVGVSANKFGVNNAVTRAQYVTWLYNYAVSKDSSVAIADDDVKATFSDVSTSAYYAKAVQWATNAGVTGGTSATTFSPNKTITRAEAIVMLWAANGRPYAGTGSEDQSVLHFTDVPTNAYYATAVTWAVQSKVTTGTSTTTFSPNSTCTRSQAVTFIHGAFVH